MFTKLTVFILKSSDVNQAFFSLFFIHIFYTVALFSTLGAAILTVHCYYDMYHEYILIGVCIIQEAIARFQTLNQKEVIYIHSFPIINLKLNINTNN